MKQLAFLVLIMLSCMIRPSRAQQVIPSVLGEIRGRVIDDKTKKGLDYVSVTIVNSRGKAAAQVLTDDYGSYVAKQLEPGEYAIKVTNLGYMNSIITGVTVAADEISFSNVTMSADRNVRSSGCYFTSCCFRGPSPEMKERKNTEYLVLQAQYRLQKNESFNCVMQHKSREIEDALKESAVKLFNEVRSFPSPANSIINIESMYDGEKEIVIRDLTGKEFYHGIIIHHLQLDVASLPVGLYIVMIIDKKNDEKSYTKFIRAN